MKRGSLIEYRAIVILVGKGMEGMRNDVVRAVALYELAIEKVHIDSNL